MMVWRRNKLAGLLVLSLLPLQVLAAPLASENFVVEGASISAPNVSAVGSSTNFAIEQESGGLYTYDAPATTTPSSSGGGGGGSAVELKEKIKDLSTDVLSKSDLVTICHSGNGKKYVALSTAQVVIALKNLGETKDLQGHHGHDFDIIPSFKYDFGNGIEQYEGKNWDTEGKVLYANNCKLFLADIEPEPEPQPVPDIPDAVSVPLKPCEEVPAESAPLPYAPDGQTLVTIETPKQVSDDPFTFNVAVTPATEVKKLVDTFIAKLKTFTLRHDDKTKLPPVLVKKVGGAIKEDVKESKKKSVAPPPSVDCLPAQPDDAPLPPVQPGDTDADSDGIPDEADPDDNNDGVPDDPRTAIIVAHKIVCTDESLLPNWGNKGGPMITKNTAANWVESNPGCSFAAGWQFQWGTQSAKNPGDNYASDGGRSWQTLRPTDSNGMTFTTVTNADIKNNKHFWFREIPRSGYVPFTFRYDRSSYSAEMYCHTDVLNYDNYDRIDGIKTNDTFYCVAWNVQEGGTQPDDDVVPLPDDDSDGVPDTNDDDSGNPDTDSDGDGVPDISDPNPTTPDIDTDGDGIPDYLDPDDDNDGIIDILDLRPLIPDIDTDGDSIPDSSDTTNSPIIIDTDGDGIPDNIDPTPYIADSDGDGVPDAFDDNLAVTSPDADGDGIPDIIDLVYDEPAPDLDGDGIADSVDPDADGDGVPDIIDLDIRVVASDTDGDGVPDELDKDANADGIPEIAMVAAEVNDIDCDGIPDYLDPDDDNDGIIDMLDLRPKIPDSDTGTAVVGAGCFVPEEVMNAFAVADTTLDTDGDGIPDFADVSPTVPEPDTDGDGVIDALDNDSDANGVLDTLEYEFMLFGGTTMLANAFAEPTISIESNELTSVDFAERDYDKAELLLPMFSVTVLDAAGRELTALPRPVEIDISNPRIVALASNVVIMQPSEDGRVWRVVPFTVDGDTVTLTLRRPGNISVWFLPQRAYAAEPGSFELPITANFTLSIPTKWFSWLVYFGLFGGLILTLLSLLKVPFSLGDIPRLLFHGWNNFIGLIVTRRRKRPWGTVYDSITKAPVDPAYVELFSIEGKKISEGITDLDGRYGFLAETGSYEMHVRKTNYTFPSVRHTLTGKDVLYSNLYYGGPFSVSNTVARDIPVDSITFDWNQYEKMRTNQTKFIHRFDPLFVRLLEFIFILGAAIMIFQFVREPNLVSGVLLAAYIGMLLLRIFAGAPILYGSIKKGNQPVPHAVVRVKRNEREIASRVADIYGRYVAIVPPGIYTIEIEERISEEEYRTIYSGIVKAKNGVINRRLRL